MIWFFLALAILAIILSRYMKKAKAQTKTDQLEQQSLAVTNKINNDDISKKMAQQTVSGALSMVEEAKQAAAQYHGTVTLTPEVEQKLQNKIEEALDAYRLENQMAAAICLAYRQQTDGEATPPAEAAADASFASSLRQAVQVEQQEKAGGYLRKLRQYAENAHQQAVDVLKQDVLKKGAALQPGDTLKAKIDLPVATISDGKELSNLMEFIGHQVDGYDLIEPSGGCGLLNWRHRDLLELYIAMIREACAPDGIRVTYEAQVQDGFDAVTVTITLPHRLTEKPRSYYMTSIVLCVSCKV